MSGRFRWLTARGVSAIQVVRITGYDLDSRLNRVLTRRLESAADGDLLRREILGRAGPIDDAVVAIRRVNEELDLSLHGGVAIRAEVTSLLQALGFSESPVYGAWSAEAPSLLMSEAFSALLSSQESMPALIFQRDSAERLQAEVDCLAGLADHAAMALESQAGLVRVLIERLETLLRRSAFGLAMASPPRVVLVGAPNAGKSTLANRLLGEDRSIVTPEPGTTRDLVESRLSIRGCPFRLVDSAGIRGTDDPVESLGIARTLRSAQDADIVLGLLDGQTGEKCQLPPNLRVALWVVTKLDLGGAKETLSRFAADGRPVIGVSAISGEGCATLKDMLFFCSPFRGPGHAGQAMPFMERHVVALGAARGAALEGDLAGSARHLRGLIQGEP